MHSLGLKPVKYTLLVWRLAAGMVSPNDNYKQRNSWSAWCLVAWRYHQKV